MKLDRLFVIIALLNFPLPGFATEVTSNAICSAAFDALKKYDGGIQVFPTDLIDESIAPKKEPHFYDFNKTPKAFQFASSIDLLINPELQNNFQNRFGQMLFHAKVLLQKLTKKYDEQEIDRLQKIFNASPKRKGKMTREFKKIAKKIGDGETFAANDIHMQHFEVKGKSHILTFLRNLQKLAEDYTFGENSQIQFLLRNSAKDGIVKDTISSEEFRKRIGKELNKRFELDSLPKYQSRLKHLDRFLGLVQHALYYGVVANTLWALSRANSMTLRGSESLLLWAIFAGTVAPLFIWVTRAAFFRDYSESPLYQQIEARLSSRKGDQYSFELQNPNQTIPIAEARGKLKIAFPVILAGFGPSLINNEKGAWFIAGFAALWMLPHIIVAIKSFFPKKPYFLSPTNFDRIDISEWISGAEEILRSPQKNDYSYLGLNLWHPEHYSGPMDSKKPSLFDLYLRYRDGDPVLTMTYRKPQWTGQ